MTNRWSDLDQETKELLTRQGTTQSQWDSLSSADKTTTLDNAIANDTISNIQTETGTSTSEGTQNLNELIALLGVAVGDQDNFVKALQQESKVRSTIINQVGQVGELQRQNTEAIFNASVFLAEFGITSDDVLKTYTEISATLGRNVILTEEQLKNQTLLRQSLGDYGRGFDDIIKQLDLLNISFEQSVELGEEMMNTARMMGVNMEQFLSNMSRNMNMLNTYNFADGVEGFGRMAAQATRLGLEMSTVSNLAERVMDPEGAIELAANLQVVGGAVGDLADPFRLMYLATNDLAGLQDQLIGVGKDLAVFNEETGQISFPPTAQRQLRALADTLGMSKEEFAEMVKLQTKFEAISNQLSLSILPSGEEGERLEEFIQSMAQVGEGGKFEIAVGDDMIEVEDLTSENIATLTEQMVDQNKTVEEIQVEQLNALDAIKNATTETAAAARDAGIVSGLEPGLIAKGISESFDVITDEFKSGLTDAFDAGFEGLREGVMGGDDIFKTLNENQVKQNTTLNDALEVETKLYKESSDYFRESMDLVRAEQERQGGVGNTETSSEDVYMPATGYNRFIFDPVKKQTTKLAVGDQLFAFRQPQSPMMNMGGEMNTNTESPTVRVTLDLPREMRLALDGQNMGNFNWRNLVANRDFVQTLKSVLASTNLATAPGPENATSSEIFYMA